MDVSVIVPLYKGRKYIPHIIDMVRENQKVLIENGINRDIEIIFVNDCPFETINFMEIPYIDDVTIQLHENAENLGIYRSRLKGLSLGRGTYILFLDQDDEISSCYLWRQLNYIGKADAVLCNGIYRRNKHIYKNLEQQRLAVSKDEYISKGNSIISPGQVLMKRSSIPNRWLNLTLQENGSDDVLLWILMFCEKKTFAVNPFDDYKHVEEGENTSLDFVSMKESVEEMLSIVRTENLLKDYTDLLLFEKAALERIRKYELYIDVNENWESIITHMEELCRLKRNIAVYGYGVLGKRLLSDLEDKGVKISFVIDKAAANFTDAHYRIYEPEKIPGQVDLIILTPLFDEKQIRKDLGEYESKIVSIMDWRNNQ